MELTRIFHFYSAFYAHKFATGFSAFQALATKIFKEDYYLNRYLKFLSIRSSGYPLELLNQTGIDTKSYKTIRSVFFFISSLVTKFKNLI